MYDVIIVGCGTVGLTIANLLAELNLKICLLEKNQKINLISNAAGINDQCLFAWKICEVIDRINPYLAHNQKGDVILKYLDKNQKEIFSLKQNYGINNLPKGVVFLQNKIDQILLENIQKKAEVNFGEEIVEILQNQQEVNIKTTNKIYRTKYLIAADGKESSIRKMLKINIKKMSQSKDEWLVLNLIKNNIQNSKQFVEVFCDSERSIVSCPLPLNYHRLEISLTKKEEKFSLDEINEKEISKIIGKNFDLKNYQIIDKLKYRFTTAIAEKYYENRVVLCGDSAHQTSPFASSGLVSGIADCLVLYDIFKNKNLDKIDFYSYQKIRYKKQIKTLKLAIILEKFMRPNKFFAKILFSLIKFLTKRNLLISFLSIRK
jgi:3-(3-hydroxy-phenyl)propionate hydroxylase